ncbi:class I SAM-dependent methyltransferase [Streptomyces erythrochromogenes]|uniref:hypothetical protein n=1 Tax=Streptomyces erythrochromogenes TaxID=285574 RepID=UPI0036C6FB3E
MTSTNAGINDLMRFYLPRSDGEPNLFEIWERGEARGDSVTPSTYSSAYREWMQDKLVGALKDHGTSRLLSLGSGNAAVESDIAQGGYRVLAVDAMPEAVAMAKAKGVDALQGDVTTWSPEGDWPVIYMDGLLGHLYTAEHGLSPTLTRIRTWLSGNATGRGTLIASNDSTQDGSAAQCAPGVDGFHWLSARYIRDEALAAGFSEVTTETFLYERPLSGERARAVITATIGH